jgi:DNA-binding NarL/FixJ family response regulator
VTGSAPPPGRVIVGTCERHSTQYERQEEMVLHITPLERTALELLASGLTAHAIAMHFGVAQSELERRLESLFARMGAANSADAVSAAVRRGILADTPSGSPVHRPF